MTGAWRMLAVDVGADADGELVARRLRRMERWMADNHKPVALVDPDGKPRSRRVCLAVPIAETGKALAFRQICGELGVAASLVQWRVAAATDCPAGLQPNGQGKRTAS